MDYLVTGGAGFIGSAVIRAALKNGHSVINLDALKYSGHHENLPDLQDHPNYTFYQVDICDYEDVLNIVYTHQPKVILHLAAETHVDRSIDNPLAFINTNILGTFNLLEAARGYVAQNQEPGLRFLHVSTDEVFGSLDYASDQLFTETTRYDPQSPYSASKASSDHLVRAWRKTYGLDTVITNCSNNYGPYQYPEKLIPLMILSALSEKPLPIYGDGSNIRDWLHVDDHADALLSVARYAKPGASYNIGGNSEFSNLSVVTKICSLLDELKPRTSGKYSDLISFTDDRPGHDERYAIDSNLIQSELKWSPSRCFDEGLRETIVWYINNEAWWRPILSGSDTLIRRGLL